MKHLFLITAYKDFKQLSFLLETLSGWGRCYVHTDLKSDVPRDFLSQWQKDENVFLYQKYKINWGSVNHVKAVNFLLDKSRNEEYDYIHIISENTMPIVSRYEFFEFFEINKGQNFMECIPARLQDKDSVRTRYFYFQHIYNARGFWGRNIEKVLVSLQKAFRINRKTGLKYKGYLYCHLTRKFADWMLEHNDYCQQMTDIVRYAYVGEEYYFQNIIKNSPFSSAVTNDSLIYDIWDKPERGLPAVLTQDDMPAAKQSGKLFARKFSSADIFLWD